MKIKNKDRKRIEEIMERFDFEKVHQAMIALDWQWADKGVPDVAQIRNWARGHLESLCREKLALYSSGGLNAARTQWGELQLTFAVSEWQTGE